MWGLTRVAATVRRARSWSGGGSNASSCFSCDLLTRFRAGCSETSGVLSRTGTTSVRGLSVQTVLKRNLLTATNNWAASGCNLHHCGDELSPTRLACASCSMTHLRTRCPRASSPRAGISKGRNVHVLLDKEKSDPSRICVTGFRIRTAATNVATLSKAFSKGLASQEREYAIYARTRPQQSSGRCSREGQPARSSPPPGLHHDGRLAERAEQEGERQETGFQANRLYALEKGYHSSTCGR